MSVLSDVEQWLEPIKGWFDPGGDPAAIHETATVWRSVAESLREVVARLSRVAAGLEQSWKSFHDAKDESASAAFRKAWGDFSAAMMEYSVNLDAHAAILDDIADEIETARLETARLMEMAIIAIGSIAAMSVFSFLVPDAVVEVSEDAAAASEVVAEMGSALGDWSALLQGLRGALVRVATRFFIGSGTGMAALMVRKVMVNHQNPLDPSTYTAGDWDNILLSGFMAMVFGEAVAKWPWLNRVANSRMLWKRALATGSMGAIGTSGGSTISQLFIQGKPIDGASVEAIGLSTLINGASGGFVGAGSVLGPSVASSAPRFLSSLLNADPGPTDLLGAPGMAPTDMLAAPGMAATDVLAAPGMAPTDALAAPGMAATDALAAPGMAPSDVLTAVAGEGRVGAANVAAAVTGASVTGAGMLTGAVTEPTGAGPAGPMVFGEQGTGAAASTAASATRIAKLLNKIPVTKNDVMRTTSGLPAGVALNVINWHIPPVFTLPKVSPISPVMPLPRLTPPPPKSETKSSG